GLWRPAQPGRRRGRGPGGVRAGLSAFRLAARQGQVPRVAGADDMAPGARLEARTAPPRRPRAGRRPPVAALRRCRAGRGGPGTARAALDRDRCAAREVSPGDSPFGHRRPRRARGGPPARRGGRHRQVAPLRGEATVGSEVAMIPRHTEPTDADLFDDLMAEMSIEPSYLLEALVRPRVTW